MTLLLTTLVYGIGFGLILYLLSLGLVVIYSMMGVLNFAHGALYMLGAYVAYTIAQHAGFWVALVVAPVMVASLAMLFEAFVLSRLAHRGTLQQLLVTFGLAVVIGEVVILVWGPAPIQTPLPAVLQGSIPLGFGTQALATLQIPVIRLFAAAIALMCLVSLAIIWRTTRLGLMLQAARQYPHVLSALGHNVPLLLRGVFAIGAGLAALAGALAAPIYVLDPSMAATMLSLVFVVVVIAGQYAIWGALVAALCVGLLQTGATLSPWPWLTPVASLLPYILMIAVLALRKPDFVGHA